MRETSIIDRRRCARPVIVSAAAVGSAAAAAAEVRRSGVDGDESYAITCLCTHNV